MKRAKSFVALALAASLVLSSAVFAYADEDLTDIAATVEEDVVEEEVVEAEVTKEEVKKDVVVIEEVLYDDLKYETRTYYSDKQVDLGEYPFINGMDDLNKKIYDTLWRTFYFTHSTESSTAYRGNNYKASFTVEDTNQFAKITLFLYFASSSVTLLDGEMTAEFFVDKAGKIEVEKAVYEKYLADREAAALEAEEGDDEAILDKDDGEEAEPGVVSSVPLGMIDARNIFVIEGYVMDFDEESKVYLVSGKENEPIVFFVVGVNEYELADETVVLSSEPLLYENRVYLPVDFFTEIIGMEAEGLPVKEAEKREMVPLAVTAREMGFTVRWNAEEQVATLLMDDEIVALVMPDVDVFTVPNPEGDDLEIQMSTAAYIEEDRLLVPEDFFEILLSHLSDISAADATSATE